ncbi:MAG: hypothetical protein K1X82_11805 [Bacteroidia bacterium]|nr:hypothetical protein [Bacteroidia bacterium]
MDYLFRPLGKLFEATFPLIKGAGPSFNMIMLGVAFIASCIWVALMIKFQKDEVPNR